MVQRSDQKRVSFSFFLTKTLIENCNGLKTKGSANFFPKRVFRRVFQSVSHKYKVNYSSNTIKNIYMLLTHFSAMLHFDIPWKRQKTCGFLTLSEGIEMEHWVKIG